MTRRTSRDEVVRALAQRDFAGLSASRREEVLLDHWSMRDDDPAFQELPEDLRREMRRSPKPERPAGDPRYDPLVLAGLRFRCIGVTNAYLGRRHGVSAAQIDGAPERLDPCPCCRYRTLRTRGDYLICPVCFWEDTGDHEGFSGPNHMTLRQGRENFRAFGACSRKDLPLVDPEGREKYERDPNGAGDGAAG